MKKVFSLIAIGVSGLLLSNSSYAQVTGYLGDVTRYSQTISGGGTARVRAMGGAQTALGGDISSAYSNPAGLGFYNRSDFSITPTFFSTGNDATYLGNSTYQYKNNLNISNIGLAFRGNKPENTTSGWLGGTFAISYQQLNNFSNNFNYQGASTESAYVDSFLRLSDTELDRLLDQGDLHTTLAYNSLLIDDDFTAIENGQEVSFFDTYFPVPSAEHPVLESESVETSGSQGQWNFSYGGNFSDRLYVGGGVGVHSIFYRRTSTFTDEIDRSFYDNNPEGLDRFPNNRFEMAEDIRQEASGINATLGIIARPVESISIGLSYRTPTFYTVEETYTLDYRTYFVDDNSVEEALSDILTFDYNLRTPGALNAGVAYFIQKNGIITADVEYIDYSNNRLTADANYLSGENQDIPMIYGAALNYRLGGELRHDNFRFRLGYAHQASPYRGGSYEGNYDTNTFNGGNTFSGGVGMRFSAFYTDLAVVQQRRDLVYYPIERPDVNIENRQTSVLLTVGFNF